MRVPAALAILLLSVSTAASSAERTVFIPLRFIPAVEAEQILFPTGHRSGFHGEGFFSGGLAAASAAKAPAKSLVPAGIVALSVDASGHALNVSGSDEAIQALQNLLRLIDIPPRRIEVSMRILKLDAAGLGKIPGFAPPVNPVGGPAEAPAVFKSLTEAQAGRLTDVPVVAETAMVCLNNHPLRVFIPDPALKSVSEILPRVNGDGTITLLMPLRTAAEAEGKPAAAALFALRRVHSGETLLLSPSGGGASLLISARLLPEPAGPPAK